MLICSTCKINTQGRLAHMASIQMRKIIRMHLCFDSLLLNGKTIDTRRSNDAAIIVNVFTLMEIVDRNGSN
jgi:hypothetical protein